MTDAQLIHEIAHGNNAAFAELYEQNRKSFINYLRGRAELVAEEVLCEICNDAYLKLIDNISCSFLRVEQDQVVNKKGNKVTVKGYLYTIGYHKLVDYCRAESIPIRNKRIDNEEMHNQRAKRIFKVVRLDDMHPQKGSDDDYESDINNIVDVSSEVETTARMDALLKAMEQLNEQCSKILSSFYYNRMSFETIAEALNYKNADTAKVQKNKCMGKLKSFATKLLKEQED